MGLTVLLSRDHHLREPGRRHPLRDPRPADAGRARLMVATAAPTSATRASTVAESRAAAGAPIRAVEPLAGRVAPLQPQQGRRRRGDRSSSSSSSTACIVPIVSRVRPERRRLRRGEPAPEPRRTRSAPTSSAATCSRARRSAAGSRSLIGVRARRSRSSSIGVVYGVDLGLRRRPARQRDDALPRRALRAARTCRSRSSRWRSSARRTSGR